VQHPGQQFPQKSREESSFKFPVTFGFIHFSQFPCHSPVQIRSRMDPFSLPR
jgi:hypothetical protein